MMRIDKLKLVSDLYLIVSNLTGSFLLCLGGGCSKKVHSNVIKHVCKHIFLTSLVSHANPKSSWGLEVFHPLCYPVCLFGF